MADIYNALDEVISRLPDLLDDVDGWEQAFSFGKPHRCTRFVRGPIYLHHFDRVPDNVVWHPHSWPMAAQIFKGSYEMSLGHGTKEDQSDLAEVCRYTVREGERYKMESPFGWHKIDLVEDEVWSLMVTGRRWLSFPMDYDKLGYSQMLEETHLSRGEKGEFLIKFKEVACAS